MAKIKKFSSFNSLKNIIYLCDFNCCYQVQLVATRTLGYAQIRLLLLHSRHCYENLRLDSVVSFCVKIDQIVVTIGEPAAMRESIHRVLIALYFRDCVTNDYCLSYQFQLQKLHKHMNHLYHKMLHYTCVPESGTHVEPTEASPQIQQLMCSVKEIVIC